MAVEELTKPMKKAQSGDDKLAEHLERAEYHLIEAVKLLSGSKRPVREGRYLKRLGGAQEVVTGLYREELVRIRGPLRVMKSRKVK